jgi:hypothetical protein
MGSANQCNSGQPTSLKDFRLIYSPKESKYNVDELCEKSWNYKTPESIVALNELSLDL